MVQQKHYLKVLGRMKLQEMFYQIVEMDIYVVLLKGITGVLKNAETILHIIMVKYSLLIITY